MCDEESDFDHSIKSLEQTDPPLATELKRVQARRIRMNHLHRTRIQRISRLPCFTGSLEAGVAVERQQTDVNGQLMYDTEDVDSETVEDEVPDANEDDWVGEQLDGLNTFMLNLSLVD
jgi:hypothetical protein